ncbi:cobyric acid synthase, partial [Candidatus Woesearchaeota archaeon]|nr:cobyric acid synthase [Candidatus Woesearchaeota archaeon]
MMKLHCCWVLIEMASIMIQGTGSGVGKSVIAAALCRIFANENYKVAPFKSQNMALNSYITEDKGEMGRAQAVQAFAARKKPRVEMNPVLLKPKEDKNAQVIVLGKAVGDKSALEYDSYKRSLIRIIRDAFNKLENENDIVVIEGAGSPAEVNLKARDIVNMKMAEIANCPVILVADIDKGGALAAIVGTLELLTKKEKERVKGIIINKFRGDISLLEDGLRYVERKTKKPIIGVIPYFNDIKIEEEDSLAEYQLNNDHDHNNTQEGINIGVIWLPHMSNFTDFDALEKEEDVSVRYVKEEKGLWGMDAIIIPGTKNSVSDLLYLKESGLYDAIKSFKGNIIGICGGFQMLGTRLIDKEGMESMHGSVEGLGLLNIESSFEREKITRQVKGRIIKSRHVVEGYEIHMGRTKGIEEKPFIELEDEGYDGAVSSDERVFGTYLHGI